MSASQCRVLLSGSGMSTEPGLPDTRSSENSLEAATGPTLSAVDQMLNESVQAL